MAQGPFQVDAIQIEPGSTGSRLISRDATTGELKFVDPELPSGAILTQFLGIRNITGIFVVGRAGDGAPYTTIQEALDAIPASSSSAAPSLVMIGPGLYTENIIIERDGVALIGMGGARLVNSGAADTVTVRASLDAKPKWVSIQNLEIKNTQNARSCLLVDGSDTFASGTITVVTAPLVAGDKVTIGGIVLTGVGATRTSGNNDFSTLGGTGGTIAADIAAAINDAANSFDTIVKATVLGSVVTVKAIRAGTIGNAITLVPLTAPVGGLTVSGATLTGGSAAGSLVASEQLLLEGCKLVSSGVGGFQVSASTIGILEIRGGTFRGSASTSSLLAKNCAAVRLIGVEWVNNLELTYDTGSSIPSDNTSEYAFANCPRINDVIAGFVGVVGDLTFRHCNVGDVTMAGRNLLLVSSYLEDLSLNDTDASLVHSPRGSLTNAGGTPTLEETAVSGTQAFVASTSQTVTFAIPQPDTSYRVLLESPSTTVTLAVTTKTADSFVIAASGVLTGTVGYTVYRDL